MDFSVLADRDCLVAVAAVVLCSDRGVEAHKMSYNYGCRPERGVHVT